MIQTDSQCFVKHVIDIVGDTAVVQSFPGYRSVVPLAKLKADGGFPEIRENYEESRLNRAKIDANRARSRLRFRDDL